MRLYRTDFLFPISGPPVQGGAVAVGEDGAVIAAGALDAVRAAAGADVPGEYRAGGICPGFVNAHVHLELSAMHGRIPEGTGLVGFVRRLQAGRGRVPPAARAAAARAAVRALREAGTVAVGDVGNSTEGFAAAGEGGLQGRFFLERFGFDPARSDAVRAEVRETLETLPAYPALHAGPTPHAVYSCSRALLEGLLRESDAAGRPSTVHLLESSDERALTERGAGPFADFLRDVGFDLRGWTPPGVGPLELLLDARAGCGAPLQLVHMTDATDADVERLRGEPNVWICLCPGANRYIERREPPVERFREAGLRLAVGTDSLASNRRLSMIDELALLKQAAPGVPTAELLGWATRGGAGFLGLADRLGTLEPGRRPGLVWLRTPGPPASADLLAHGPVSSLRLDGHRAPEIGNP